MPRKKTKKQFRRGSEQQYRKVAIYHTTQPASSQVNIPYVPLFVFACFAVLIATGLLFRTTVQTLIHLPELPTLRWPDIAIPTLALPHIQIPHLQLPTITLTFPDIGQLVANWYQAVTTFFLKIQNTVVTSLTIGWSSLVKIAQTIAAVSKNLYLSIVSIDLTPLVVTLNLIRDMIMTSIASILRFSVMYVNPWIVYQKSLEWEAAAVIMISNNFLITMQWIVRQYIQVATAQYNIGLSIGKQVLYYVVIACTMTLTAIQIALNFLASAGIAIARGITSIIASIGHGISIAWSIISQKVHNIVEVVSPIITYLMDMLKLTLSELASGIGRVFGTVGDLATTYHESTKNF